MKITGRMVYDALDQSLDDCAYLATQFTAKEEETYSCVIVDGDLDCDKLAELLNKELEKQ